MSDNSITNKKEKKKKGFDFWIGLLVLIVAAIGAKHLSKIPINVTNLAVPFDNDLSKCTFSETATDEPFFSDEEVEWLTQAVRETAEKVQMNVIVQAARTPLDDYETIDYANYTYDSICGEHTDGIFFYLDMSGKTPAFDYISTSAKGVLCYNSNIIDLILDDVYEFLPTSSDVAENGYEPYRENIKKGIYAFLKGVENYGLFYAGDEGSYVRSSNSDKYMYFLNDEFYVTTSRPPKQKFNLMLAGLIIGFIAALIFNSSIKRKYVFVSPENPQRYISDEDANLQMTDTFLRENTTKRYNPPSSSSSSGSRSHGGGGGYHGGSHGGGGRHR